uniref:Uncharacterized protein n=1 Tax=Monodelphis domestica TaxID=13616 RepID=H9H9B2_MONDO
MEAKELIENLKAELTCSICLGYFTDPVTALKCGHTFCKDCLLQCDEQADATLTCPECKAVTRFSDTVPIKNLQDFSITGKTLIQKLLFSLPLLTTCDQHGEKEKLFCEQDQKLICGSCLLTQEHKDHQDLPLQMAADKCKKKLQETLNVLQKKDGELKAENNDMGKQEENANKHADLYKKLIRCEYKKMHEILYDEENEHLQKLNQDLEDNLAKVQTNKAILSEQIQLFQQMILEIEESLNASPFKMLQDMKGILERNEELRLQETQTVNLTFTSSR